MSRRPGVEELELLLIDGDNLLHDVRGSRDEGGVAWLLPRLSGWRPQHLRVIVGLDGHPAAGEASRTKATRSRCLGSMFACTLNTNPLKERRTCPRNRSGWDS